MPRIVHALPARRVVQAYSAIFAGTGSPEDARLVLNDLEAFAGLWEVTTAETPDGETKYAEGQRSVLAHIQALSRVSETTLDEIDRRARENEEI